MKVLKGKLWDVCNAETGEKIADCIVGKFICFEKEREHPKFKIGEDVVTDTGILFKIKDIEFDTWAWDEDNLKRKGDKHDWNSRNKKL